jgi:hypothetical protein
LAQPLVKLGHTSAIQVGRHRCASWSSVLLLYAAAARRNDVAPPIPPDHHVCMMLDEAIAALVEAAEEWRSGGDAKVVVRAACEVLAAGHDGMAIATLAGVELADADDKVAGFLVDALAEVSVPFFLSGTDAEQVAWLASKARLLVQGALSPRELAESASSAIGNATCEASQRLVDLAFQYVLADGNDVDAWDLAEIDALVVTEARHLSEQA